METVIVYSPVEDKKIKANLNESPIWAKDKAFNEEEYQENPKRFSFWWKYTFKFVGLIPKQVTNVEKLAN